MKDRLRAVAVILALVLALVFVPAAIAVPSGAPSVRGTITDASTGVAIPFAWVEVETSPGTWVPVRCGYDGTYSCPTAGNVTVHVDADAWDRISDDAEVLVGTGPVTQDFSLARNAEFSQPIYRFFNMRGGVHFYTASDQEFINTYRDLSGVYKYDGIAYHVPWGTSTNPNYINPNTFPLYRFYNHTTGVHFYTMSEAEKAQVLATRKKDYTYEGVAYCVSDREILRVTTADVFTQPSFPVYRFYVPKRDAHFFTAYTSEVFGAASGPSSSYNYEGIGFYINDWRNVPQ